ncbi:3060_t:CDS:2, partial [Paraglomus occultum]
REIEDRLYVEARALFLHTRNTSAELLENMASEILNRIPQTGRSGKNFECTKQPSVPSKQEYRERYGDEILNSNLSEFVDDYVWRNILRLPLLGVVKMELNKDRAMCESLRKFVVKALEKWIIALMNGNDAKSDEQESESSGVDLEIDGEIFDQYPEEEGDINMQNLNAKTCDKASQNVSSFNGAYGPYFPNFTAAMLFIWVTKHNTICVKKP